MLRARITLRQIALADVLFVAMLLGGCVFGGETSAVDAGPPVPGDDGGESGHSPDAAVPPDAEALGIACEGSTRRVVPADPAATGPWPVGARTFTVDRLTAEVFYPAAPGSEAGEAKVRYDLRKSLPVSQHEKIPDEDNPWMTCDCYRDVPIDDRHGPYPVIFFIHGTAAFRTQSLTQLTHWASRGFVVVTADHPGLWLADMLAMACPDSATGAQDLTGDLDLLIEAVREPADQLAFLVGNVEMDRIGLAGHSGGGNAVVQAADSTGAKVVIPMAANAAVGAAENLEARVYLGGLSDSVVRYGDTQEAFSESAPPKQLLGIAEPGHLVFSDICEATNTSGQNLIEIANQHGICGAFLGGMLFDCDPDFLDAAIADEIVNYATTAALERVLHCVTGEDLFAGLQERFPDVSEYLEVP